MDRKKILRIPEAHSLEHVGFRMRGTLQQTDIDEYEERDAEGKLVAKYVFTADTSIKAPFGTSHSYQSFDPDGNPLTYMTAFDPDLQEKAL